MEASGKVRRCAAHGRWGGGWVAVAAALVLIAACSGAPRPDARSELANWASGPVRWLMQPEEWRRLRRVTTPAEAISFIEEFWRRRDEAPTSPGNLARELFQQRVEAADLLYAERGLRGSLSDRGRALILLGSPSHLQVTSRPVLSWDVTDSRPERVTSERLTYEIWAFRVPDLPPRLVELVAARGADAEAIVLRLTFATGERTYLVEGGDLLELAARATVLD